MDNRAISHQAGILLDFDCGQDTILLFDSIAFGWQIKPDTLKATKLRRTTVKQTLCICLLGLGLACLLVSGATAQENFVAGGVAGVRGLHGHAVLPPWIIFSNCGSGCTSYNTGSGYYVSGTAISGGPGQTLAMGITPARTVTFLFALTPNTVYTSNGGASSGKMSAYLLNGSSSTGPTTLLAKLTQHGTIPDYPSIKTIKYTSKKTVTLKKGVTYFVCETEPVADVQLLWMVSNSDTTSPFWFQDSDSCTATGLTWLNATGAADGAAFEVVHTH